MVTPFSQFVGTQAVMNVMGEERYATIPDDVVVYFLGGFGKPPAPPDAAVVDRVLSLPRAQELRKVEPLTVDRSKFPRSSDEELLLRLTMPAEQVDAMRAALPPRRTDPSPVVQLLRELTRRPAIEYLRLETADDLVEYRRR
jgi:oxaloacetate decarboxylase alpha subunit